MYVRISVKRGAERVHETRAGKPRRINSKEQPFGHSELAPGLEALFNQRGVA